MSTLLDSTLREELNFVPSCKFTFDDLYHSRVFMLLCREQIFSMATIYQIFGNNSLADRAEKLG